MNSTSVTLYIMMRVIEYLIRFECEIKNDDNVHIWIDNFKLNDEWPVLIFEDVRRIKRTYMGKEPYLSPPKTNSNLLLFSKNRWYCINTYNEKGDKFFKGSVVSGSDKVYIPNTNTNIIEVIPYHVIYEFYFDFYIMGTILGLNSDVDIMEYKKVNFLKMLITYNKMKITIYGSIIAYKGDRIDDFLQFCEDVKTVYESDSIALKPLFDSIKGSIDQNKSHISLAYVTWYNAKRELQTEWPDISKEKPDESLVKNWIEFPEGSKIYYFSKDYYVGLIKRTDDNPEKYIPKLFKKDLYTTFKKVDKISLETTYSELDEDNNKDVLSTFSKVGSKDVLPSFFKSGYKEEVAYNTIKINFRNKLLPLNKRYEFNKNDNIGYIRIDYTGKIIETTENPRIAVFNDIIISNSLNEEYQNVDKIYYLNRIIPFKNVFGQLLDRLNQRVSILILYENERIWVNSNGPKLVNIPALPYNYKQIIHDYYKLGRLQEGELIDLTHIGIVNEYGTDIITFSSIDLNSIYISQVLQTKRLLTFKPQYNVIDSYQL